MRRVLPYVAVVGWVLLAVALVVGVAWTLHRVHLAEPYGNPESGAVRRVGGRVGADRLIPRRLLRFLVTSG